MHAYINTNIQTYIYIYIYAKASYEFHVHVSLNLDGFRELWWVVGWVKLSHGGMTLGTYIEVFEVWDILVADPTIPTL